MRLPHLSSELPYRGFAVLETGITSNIPLHLTPGQSKLEREVLYLTQGRNNGAHEREMLL